MQLDNTRIAVRERGLLDIMDLSLRVLRSYAWPIVTASAVLMVPLAFLNNWLLRDVLRHSDFSEGLPTDYLWRLGALVIWEMPLATAPVTLFLGQALFGQQAGAKRIAQDFFGSLPQLIVYQVILRGLFVMLVITLLVIFASWAFLNEVILLERNSLFAGRNRMSTYRRTQNLHSGATGDLLSRWLGSVLLGSLLVMILWFTLWYARILITHNYEFDRAMYTIYLPAAVWVVVGYFSVVRFLSYLDLRIRREGWEVELRMRAEGARLSRRLA